MMGWAMGRPIIPVEHIGTLFESVFFGRTLFNRALFRIHQVGGSLLSP